MGQYQERRQLFNYHSHHTLDHDGSKRSTPPQPILGVFRVSFVVSPVFPRQAYKP